MSLVASLSPPDLTRIGQAAGHHILGDTVTHLVSGNVDGHQRVGVAGPVAIRHLRAVPERVHVVVAVVDPRRYPRAGVEYAITAMHVLEVVKGEGRAVVRVDRRPTGPTSSIVSQTCRRR